MENENKEYATEIVSTYVKLEYKDIELSDPSRFRLDTRDSDCFDECFYRYQREIYLKIYGLTQEDFDFDLDGKEIGTLFGTFYDMGLLEEDCMEKWYVFDALDYDSSVLYSLLFLNEEDDDDSFCEKIGFDDNIFYINDLSIKKKYDTDNLRKEILNSIERDLSILFGYKIGCLVFRNLGGDLNQITNKKSMNSTLKDLGFTEISSEISDYSILYINTDFKFTDYKIIDCNTSETVDIIQNVRLQSGGIIHELEPFNEGKVRRWITNYKDYNIMIYENYADCYCYELYKDNKRIFQDMHIYYIDDYELMDIYDLAKGEINNLYIRENRADDNVIMLNANRGSDNTIYANLDINFNVIEARKETSFKIYESEKNIVLEAVEYCIDSAEDDMNSEYLSEDDKEYSSIEYQKSKKLYSKLEKAFSENNKKNFFNVKMDFYEIESIQSQLEWFVEDMPEWDFDIRKQRLFNRISKLYEKRNNVVRPVLAYVD